MKHETILTPLATVKQRHRAQRLIEGTSWGLFTGSLVALPFLIAHLFGGLGGWNPLLLLTASAGIGILIGAMLAWLLPVDSQKSAQHVDRHYQFKDRLLTALKFITHAEATPMQRLQLEDATRHARQVDPKVVQPYRLPKNFSWTLGVTLLAATICFVSPFFNKEQAVVAAEPLPEVVAVIETLRENLIERMDELAEEHPEEETLRELADQLKDLLAQLDESSNDRRESLGTLSEMEAAIRNTLNAFQLESVDVSMRELADALSAADATRAAGQAMRDGQYARAADELENLNPDSMSRQERRAVAEQMRQAAQSMNRRGQQSLTEATLQMAEGLENNDAAQCQAGACALAGECRTQGLRRGIAEALEGQLALLAFSKSQCNAGGQCQSCGGGQCSSCGGGMCNSNQPNQNAGTAAVGNPTSGEETSLDSARQRQDLTGMMGSQGDSQIERMATEGQQEQAGREFRDVFQDFQRMSEAVLETEPIPLGQRQMIRRYFESIRPTE